MLLGKNLQGGSLKKYADNFVGHPPSPPKQTNKQTNKQQPQQQQQQQQQQHRSALVKLHEPDHVVIHKLSGCVGTTLELCKCVSVIEVIHLPILAWPKIHPSAH